MTCQDVFLARGMCRIEVSSELPNPGVPSYTARMSLLEDDGRVVRPLVFSDGRRAEIHATSELLALRSAVTYLEQRFGGLSEPEHECTAGGPDEVRGDPFVIGQ